MTSGSTSPGPIADQTFDRGFRFAALAGLAGIAVLYWSGKLSVSNVMQVTSTLLLFPVYLLFISIVLGMWLGYETDETDLERVIEDPDVESDDSLGNQP